MRLKTSNLLEAPEISFGQGDLKDEKDHDGGRDGSKHEQLP